MAKKKKTRINQNDQQKERRELLTKLEELKDDLIGFNAETDEMIYGLKTPKGTKDIQRMIRFLEAEKAAITRRYFEVSDIDWGQEAVKQRTFEFQDEADVATKWAFIKRFEELRRDGFIPEDIELDKYEGASVIEKMLRYDELRRVVEEAEEKKEHLIEVDKVRRQQSLARAKRLGQMLKLKSEE